MVPIDLSGKAAVVTGSSQGLGEATVRLLHKAGASPRRWRGCLSAASSGSGGSTSS